MRPRIKRSKTDPGEAGASDSESESEFDVRPEVITAFLCDWIDTRALSVPCSAKAIVSH